MYKLVIADDEFEIRNGLSNYFPWHDVGFQVVYTASNGKEVIEYISSHPVDVILSDIKMPVLSGLDLAAYVASLDQNIIFLLLSGFTDFEYAQKAISYKVREYLVKPTKYTQILEVFNAIKKELDASSSSPPASLESPISCDHQSIQFMLDYTQKNLATVSLEDIATKIYMNPYYLSKLFKEKTNQNFSDYIFKLKMKKAAELMCDSSYRTYEISEMLGYTNPKNFSRAFKKFYNQSPAEYRTSLARKFFIK